ncbi:MAG: transrane sensor [Mucilaginibacter sp.]|nr:transrane sensor [Mucilaginibacter sp.]
MKRPISVELLEKYINGECTATEVALIKQWYQSFENDTDYVSEISPREEKELEDRIYRHILNNISVEAGEEEIASKKSGYRSLRKWYAMAAAAAAVFVVIAVIYQNQKTKAVIAPDIDAQIIAITNNSNQIYKATLPDNSCVWVSPHSQLRFPKAFGPDSRMVSMSGKCFFEVTKNPKCPFIINSKSIITKVWGTSFLVRDDDKSNSAEVSVLTGKVSVSIKNAVNTASVSSRVEKDEVMLYPHQKVIYVADLHVLKQENIVAEPSLQIWKRVDLSFDNKPLKEIIPVLNSAFHIHIKVANEKLNHYILNADLAGFNLPDVLEALKKSLNVSYEIKNDIIEIE